MLALQIICVLFAIATLSYAQKYTNLIGDPKMNLGPDFNDFGSKMPPIGYYTLTSVDKRMPVSSADNIDLISAPSVANGLKEHIANQDCATLQADASALDASFPRIVGSSAGRRHSRKAIRSPCSSQISDDVSSQTDDGRANQDEASDGSSDSSSQNGDNVQSQSSSINSPSSISSTNDSNSNSSDGSQSSSSLNPENAENSESNSTVRQSRNLNDGLTGSKSDTATNLLKAPSATSVSINLPEPVRSQHLVSLDHPKLMSGTGISKTSKASMPSSVTLDPVYPIPDVDTPARPTMNSKRAIQKPRPLLRRKSLKQTNSASVIAEISPTSESNLTNDQALQVQHDVSMIHKEEPSDNSNKAPVPLTIRGNKTLQKKIASKKPITINGLQSPTAGASPEKQSIHTGNSDMDHSVADQQSKVSALHAQNVEPQDAKRVGVSQPEHIPCTCGVFLSGQFTKGSRAEPTGNPVVEHQLGQTFPCSAAGKSQCQNKCVDMMVKHLPNSAAIICGSVDKDVYKEKAYLWVKNCQDVWLNSNLSTGKEHCCKDNLPIKCSQMEKETSR